MLYFVSSFILVLKSNAFGFKIENMWRLYKLIHINGRIAVG